MADKPEWEAFTVETSKDAGPDEKPFYRSIGAAFKTKAGTGLMLTMKALPIDGRVLLLPYKEKVPKG